MVTVKTFSQVTSFCCRSFSLQFKYIRIRHIYKEKQFFTGRECCSTAAYECSCKGDTLVLFAKAVEIITNISKKCVPVSGRAIWIEENQFKWISLGPKEEGNISCNNLNKRTSCELFWLCFSYSTCDCSYEVIFPQWVVTKIRFTKSYPLTCSPLTQVDVCPDPCFQKSSCKPQSNYAR